MATIQHKDIPNAQLHEPKGVSAASVDQLYVADGLGSGTWQKLDPTQLAGVTGFGVSGAIPESDGAGGWTLRKHPYGMTYFENIAAPYTLTYPATYTKAAPTTTASGVGYLVTEGTNARLTYLGPGEIMDVFVNVSLSQSIGADRDIRLAVYKNGAKVNGSVGILTTVSGQKRFIQGAAVVSMATNDYVECFLQNDGASGDISIYSFALFLDPH